MPKPQKTREERAKSLAQARADADKWAEDRKARKAEAKAKKAKAKAAEPSQKKRTTRATAATTAMLKPPKAPKAPKAPKQTNTVTATVSAAQVEGAIVQSNDNQKRLNVLEGDFETLNDKVDDASEQIATTRKDVKYLKVFALECSSSLKKQGLMIIQHSKELVVNRFLFVAIAIALAYIFKCL